MNSLSDALNDEVLKLVHEFQATMTDGRLEWREAVALVHKAVEALVRTAAAWQLAGSEKKEQVLAALEALFDTVIAPLDIPQIPDWLERTVIDRALRALIRPLLGPMIDRLEERMKAEG